ncbi:MAG: hypothetical protein HGN29_07825 [Asgard group archaeon]|nr:hypothetical protein [Asgard group archaeon]
MIYLVWSGFVVLFGMVVLIVLMTIFYLVFRKRYIQPTITIIIWLFFLFMATTISMIALAYSNLGAWRIFKLCLLWLLFI